MEPKDGRNPYQIDITPAQERALEYIAQKMTSNFVYGKPEEYEFKAWELDYLFDNEEANSMWGGRKTPVGRILTLVAEVGSVGDEGTAAAWVCRNRVQLFIGQRGGISAYRTNMRNPEKQITVTGAAAIRTGYDRH